MRQYVSQSQFRSALSAHGERTADSNALSLAANVGGNYEMNKSDKSMHGVVLASIKRSTFKPYDYEWTRFYESNSDFQYEGINLDLSDTELIICSVMVDSDNYSILTTRKLITVENGIRASGQIRGSVDKGYGNFKGYGGETFTFGSIQLSDGSDLKYFVETGKGSMIMVHGIRTLIKIQPLTAKNVENLTRVWNRGEKK